MQQNSWLNPRLVCNCTKWAHLLTEIKTTREEVVQFATTKQWEQLLSWTSSPTHDRMLPRRNAVGWINNSKNWKLTRSVNHAKNSGTPGLDLDFISWVILDELVRYTWRSLSFTVYDSSVTSSCVFFRVQPGPWSTHCLHYDLSPFNSNLWAWSHLRLSHKNYVIRRWIPFLRSRSLM